MIDNPNDLFEIKIIPTVYTLWNELGIPETQRTEEIKALNESFHKMYIEFVSHLSNKCEEARNEINEIHAKHKQAMKAYGISDEDIEAIFSSNEYKLQTNNLLNQLDIAKKLYETFKLEIHERVSKIENLIHISNELFDILNIKQKERGEFSALGETDFTRERIDRFKAKIDELTKIKNERKQKEKSLKDGINSLLKELNTTLKETMDRETMNSTLLSEEQLEKLHNLKIKFDKKKEQRVLEISEMAVTITHLWDLLKIADKERSKFLASHSTLGDDVVMSCHEEISKLSALRDQKLPELIAEQRQEVVALWDTLHIAVESRPRFSDSDAENLSESERNVQEFKFLESEIIRLKKISVECHGILDSINQREDIINDYNEVLEATADPHRLMSRGRGYAQQLMKEEKARRRYKVSLPRIEKKLYVQLVEYKAKNQIDFEWDGKPYIENLAHIEQIDIVSSLDGVKKKKSKKSKKQNDQKIRTLPPSPRKLPFFHNENVPANMKAFSIRARSPIKM